MKAAVRQVALVTGAGRGIGRAIALRLSDEGTAVGVNDVDADAAERTAREIQAGGGDALAVGGDVAASREVVDLVERLEAALGPPTILVNNAAAMTMAPLDELEPPEWRRVLATNLDGAFYCTRSVVPGMLRAGLGRIVNIASDWGVRGAQDASHYAASKGGLISFTKAIARELSPHGITANAVAPGPVDTPQLEVDAAHDGRSLDEMRARYAAQAPLGRIGLPTDVAATVAYLVSDAAACVTGQVLGPNGGVSM